MSSNDLPVIVYKILAYIYESMKAGVEPTAQEARRLCACNDMMFESAIAEIAEAGYARGIRAEFYYSGPEVSFERARLTLDGSDYLLNNSTMAKAKAAAGGLFQSVLSQTVQAAFTAMQ